jgi:D-glycero-D-manno-heptose 1,7-bisphosphate phosphatase
MTLILDLNKDKDAFEVKPALCLDFDGTIRYSVSGKFIETPGDIRLFDGVEEKIWEYKEQGYLICGITNQGGVAFGFKTEEDHNKEVERTLSLFKKNPFDLIQVSFNHPKGRAFPYKFRSLMRKPDYGMLVLCEAQAKESGIIIDWDESIFVGDREEDQQCAESAEVKFISANEFFSREINAQD